jgi:hypothetical protein
METYHNDSSSSTNTILIVIVLIILVGLGVWWFSARGGAGDSLDVNVDVPNVDLPGGDSGTQ